MDRRDDSNGFVRAIALFAAILVGVVHLAQAAAPVAVSDDFNAQNLDTGLWTFVDPRGDSTITLEGAGGWNARILISVPAGASHDVWTGGNFAPRIVQIVHDADFEVEVKFDSPLSETYQMQGVLFQQDAANFVRFDFYSAGPINKVFAAVFVDGAPTVKANVQIGPGAPLYMRVVRSGDQWTQLYSYDGQTWIASVSFAHAITVATAGIFAGNGGDPAPAFTSSIDYFFDTSSPIVREDGSPSVDTAAPLVYRRSDTASSGSFTVAWRTDEPSRGWVEYGATDDRELGSEAAPGDFATEHEVRIGGLAPDTVYHYRIVSEDPAGNRSSSASFIGRTLPSPSAFPVISAWYGAQQKFGNVGVPQTWVNLLGNVTGSNPITSLTYSLNGGTPRPLSIGPNSRRLARAGDFNAEIAFSELLTGQNHADITATDSASLTTVKPVDFPYPAGNVWPGTYTIDWSSVVNIQDAVQVVDGLWMLEADSLRPVQIGYDRLVAIGQRTWSDYEVTVPVTIHSIDPNGYGFPSNGPLVGIVMRWNGHTDYLGGQPRNGYLPYGAAACYLWQNNPPGDRLFMFGNNDSTMAQDLSGRHLQYEVRYLFKMRVQNYQGRGQYSFKVWTDGQPEPPTWDLTGQGELGDPQSGSFLLNAHHVDASFGDVVVTPVSDVSPPVLSNIQPVPSATDATVSWGTNEPATSKIEYGHTTAYENGTIADTTLLTQRTLILSGLDPQTIYHYRVSSSDASGNVSVSTDRSFMTNPLPPPSTIESDDFSDPPLDTNRWTLLDPRGDATLTLTGAAQLSLSIPGGLTHDLWSGENLAPRILQPANNTDFEVEIKMESSLTQAHQTHGILIRQNDANFIRFDLNFNGGARVFAASFANGSPTVRVNASIPGTVPVFLRVRRRGDQWTELYSFNGTTWTPAVSFNYPLGVGSVGVFIANAGAAPAPHTALFDYFFNATSPIVPEDGTVLPPPVATLLANRDAADVVLDWSAVERATSYRVYASTSPWLAHSAWTLLGTVAGTQYRHVGGGASGGNRFYSIAPVSSAGEGPW